MARELSLHAEVRVIGPRGAAQLAPPMVVIDEISFRPLWKFLIWLQWRACRQARRWRPDIIIAGSGLTSLPAWIAARLCGAKVVSYVHGLDVAVRHPLYRLLWLSALRRMDRVIANSRPTAELAKSIGVPLSRLGIVHPGVELPHHVVDHDAIARFLAEHELDGRPIIVSVGRLTERKGLRQFVVAALPAIVASIPDVVLLIVGDVPGDALRAEAQTPESILEAAERAGVRRNIRFLGVITDYVSLGLVYAAARVHIFPVRELPGDPEGFGMVAIEAAVHGLPTVAFATGGVVDAVADGRSGCLVPSGNYTGFAEAVIRLAAPAERSQNQCLAFGAQFAWSMFGERIVAEMQSLAEFRDCD